MRYHVTTLPDGFTLTQTRPPAPPSLVRLHATGFTLSHDTGLQTRFGFFETTALIRDMIHYPLLAVFDGHPYKWRAVLIQTTARHLAGLLTDQWPRLLRLADPTVLAVQHALFVATLAHPPIIHLPELYAHPWLPRDIIRFRAAAIAAATSEPVHQVPIAPHPNHCFVDPATGEPYFYPGGDGAEQAITPRVMREDALVTQLQATRSIHKRTFRFPVEAEGTNGCFGYDFNYFHAQEYDPYYEDHLSPRDELPPATTTVTTADLVLHELVNWRGLFAPNSQPYRSLNKTLMHLPPVPPTLLWALRHIRLERPITNRLELLLLLTHADRGDRAPQRHRHIYMHATEAAIRAALQRVGHETRNVLRGHHPQDLRTLVDFLNDYPEAHHGTLLGLVDKSIAWHRRSYQERLARSLPTAYRADVATVCPPIALPADPQIRFLASVGDVVAEGCLMKHCIANYAEYAVQGQCYLFHIEHGGELATTQVAADGQVLQSYGPYNQRNQAALWGQQMLTQWGHGLAPAPWARQDQTQHAERPGTQPH